MFPLNQDTFVEYSGNTANDIYDDGSGYIYMMKEGRGRSNAGGNFLVSKQLDNWYFELNSLLEDGISLYNDGNYHGEIWSSRKCCLSTPGNCLVADRIIHRFRSDGSERGKNAYGYTDNMGNFVDQSDRSGWRY